MTRFSPSLSGRPRHIVLRFWECCILMPKFISKPRLTRFVRHFDAADLIVRVLALPHLFIAFWIILLLWGEVWVFQSSVKQCQWDKWEKWPKNASPHHLIFLADPQLIDPHSYPTRPWPLDELTIILTDKYLKRSYNNLQKLLRPDTVIFLGDLFDGGREWKTFRSNKKDSPWSEEERPTSELLHARKWAKKYGEDFWLREYDRFGKIFYESSKLGGLNPRPWQRGKKIISSLPGNHDLGFGDHIKLSVRDRFQAYFGEGNRVDVIGNHTFVSVDSVSLSASESDHDVAEITRPVNEFLATVQIIKRKAVARELAYMTGKDLMVQYAHKVEDLITANLTAPPTSDPGSGSVELPTILLTHVPLYREPGTPCGPQREKWPPTVPPKGQNTAVIPDERNAISISRGYQYQNVLSPSDSIRLISSVGNVGSVFSGDDHDYCEIVHSADKNNAKEITVKSLSWAMGVRRPGFLLLSMWNPVDQFGRPMHEFKYNSDSSINQTSITTESHLCLLPDEIAILISYVCLTVITLAALLLRSALIPTLHLKPYILGDSSFDLPIARTSSKLKLYHLPPKSSSSSSNRSIKLLMSRKNKSETPPSGYNNSFIPAPNYYDNQNLCESNFECSEDNTKASSRFMRAKRKFSIGTLIFKETLAGIWRITWLVLLVYLFLFWCH